MPPSRWSAPAPPGWAALAAGERAEALCAAAGRAARAPAGAGRAGGARVRQAVARGRRRRVRGDRLPRVLRPSGAWSWRAAASWCRRPGEHNRFRYVPRGVAAVISPWNFPLAIPAGMTAAALATGNAVVLKPAEQSPACAAELVRALHEGGVPADALALVPGEGDAGAALVRHPGREHDRVHRLGRGGAGDRAGRGGHGRGPAPHQARDRRAGRQELRAGGVGRRPGRGRPGDRVLRLRLRRSEVLGRLARAGPRGDRRRAEHAPGRGRARR